VVEQTENLTLLSDGEQQRAVCDLPPVVEQDDRGQALPKVRVTSKIKIQKRQSPSKSISLAG